LDIDIKKVRIFRMIARIIQYGILFFLSLLVLFFFCFIVFQGKEIDYRFLFFAIVPFLFFLYQEIKEYFSPDCFLLKVNRWLEKEGMHARLPTETEKNITQSFFEDNGFDMPFLLTEETFGKINAFACRFSGKEFLLITEDTYWRCSPQEIWVILAHEKGHFLNDGVFEMYLKNIILFLSSWLSIIALIKIFTFCFFFSPFLYSPFLYFIVACIAVSFLGVFKKTCEEILYLAIEVLADNSAARILGSPEPMIKILQKFTKEGGLFIRERKFALSLITKKET